MFWLSASCVQLVDRVRVIILLMYGLLYNSKRGRVVYVMNVGENDRQTDMKVMFSSIDEFSTSDLNFERLPCIRYSTSE